MNGFAHPWLLPLAAAAPLLAWLTARRNRHQRVPALATARRRIRLAQAAPAIALLGVAAAWAAAAGPARLFMSRSPSSGRDVVVLLDVSASMGARGEGGDALAAARRAVQTLAAARHDDRLALVAFGARAAVVSPLTHDHATLIALMSNLAPAALGPRTALGDGLAVALELLRGSARGSAGIVLVTDGESNAGADEPAAGAGRDGPQQCLVHSPRAPLGLAPRYGHGVHGDPAIGGGLGRSERVERARVALAVGDEDDARAAARAPAQQFERHREPVAECGAGPKSGRREVRHERDQCRVIVGEGRHHGRVGAERDERQPVVA